MYRCRSYDRIRISLKFVPQRFHYPLLDWLLFLANTPPHFTNLYGVRHLDGAFLGKRFKNSSIY